MLVEQITRPFTSVKLSLATSLLQLDSIKKSYSKKTKPNSASFDNIHSLQHLHGTLDCVSLRSLLVLQGVRISVNMTSQLAQLLVPYYRFYAAAGMRLHILLSAGLVMHARKVVTSVFMKQRTISLSWPRVLSQQDFALQDSVLFPPSITLPKPYLTGH